MLLATVHHWLSWPRAVSSTISASHISFHLFPALPPLNFICPGAKRRVKLGHSSLATNFSVFQCQAWRGAIWAPSLGTLSRSRDEHPNWTKIERTLWWRHEQALIRCSSLIRVCLQVQANAVGWPITWSPYVKIMFSVSHPLFALCLWYSTCWPVTFSLPFLSTSCTVFPLHIVKIRIVRKRRQRVFHPTWCCFWLAEN